MHSPRKTVRPCAVCLAALFAALPVRGQPDAGPDDDAGAAQDAGVPHDAGTAPDAGPPPPAGMDELWGSLVADVVVEVPPGIDRVTAEQLFGVRRGDRLDATAVRRGLRRLVLLAKMEDVRVWAEPLAEGPDSVRVTVQLVRANLLREIRFVGADDIPATSLRRGLALHEADAADPAALEAARMAVADALAQEGYPHARVQAEYRPLPETAQVALVFTVEKGLPQKTLAIRLQGDLRHPAYKLLDIADLGPGGLASRTRLEGAAERLLKWYRAQGHWGARVEPLRVPRSTRGEWVPLTLRIAAGPRWSTEFRGNRVFSSTELRGRLGLPPDRVLDGEVAAALGEQVRAYYRDAGYPHARVSVRAAPGLERGTRRVLFSIREGPYAEVRRVTLKGNPGLRRQQLVDEAVLAAEEELPSDNLIQRLDRHDVDAVLGSGDPEAAALPQGADARAPGVPEWPRTAVGRLVDRERVWDEKRFHKGARAMEDLYKSQGYLQPRVVGPQATYRDDGRQVDVTYTVQSGVQTRIRYLSFRGNAAVLSKDLLEVARQVKGAHRVDPGEPMDLFSVEEARLALEADYANRGYPFARVTDDVVYGKDRSQAGLVYVVDEGPRIRVRDVVVRGNRATRALLINNRLTLRPGALFTAHDVEETRRALLATGLFSSVTVALDPADTGESRTVLVDVRERNYGDGETRIGLSTEQGPRLYAGGSYRNLFGLGMATSGHVRVNWPYPTYFIGFFQNPEQLDKLIGRFDDAALPYPEPAARLGVPPPPTVPGPVMNVVRPALFTEAEALASLAYPRLPFVPLESGVRAEGIFVRANRLAFTLTKGGVIWTLDTKAPSFKYLRASASPSTSLQVSSMRCEVQLSGSAAADTTGRTCADDPLRLTARQDNGVLGLWTLRLPVVLDGRDNIFNPHAGYLVTGSADLVLGGGVLYGATPLSGNLAENQRPVRSTFARFAGAVNGYLPLTRRVTLAISGRVGSIIPIDDKNTPLEDSPLPLDDRARAEMRDFRSSVSNYVPLFERFYLGGSDSVRGFTPDGVLASDDPAGRLAQRPLTSQGGNGFWNVRTELRFPIVGPWEGGLFLDAGQLLLAWENFNPAEFSAGAGVGLRVNTPVGPLIIDIGFGFLDGPRGLGLQQGEIQRRFVLHPALGYF
ncbi:MAG: BamA/TamA family outer membrane protein [Deltaproteobacteria bacterium]|nr:BamA/TamA family outer membrane protein [Deltaproteobacteria bacterium]